MTAFDGAAAAIFEGKRAVGFDSACCLFIYNTIPKRFGIDVTKIAHRFVVDFDTKKYIDADQAFLVLDTQIRGFKGYALVPFASKERAEAFKSEFKGKQIIQLRSTRTEQVDR